MTTVLEPEVREVLVATRLSLDKLRAEVELLRAEVRALAHKGGPGLAKCKLERRGEHHG